jgi:hypothetical protein
MMKTEHDTHKLIAIQIDFRGWKNEADMEDIGAATNDAF